MISRLAKWARPLLFRLDPETAHHLTIAALQIAPLPKSVPEDPRLSVEAFGLSFSNPLGLAAGFDKNAQVPDRMARLGFGFVEVGTVTPRPQAGNPRPRLFRLAQDEAAINRFGFNNEGHASVHQRLLAHPCTAVPLGINLGANKDTEDRAGDYVQGIGRFADVASYFTINVSSPNTPGLRDLQGAQALDDLLARVLAARDVASEHHGRKPVLLKIAPDLTLNELDAIVSTARQKKIDGLIVSNTTVTRPPSLRGAAQSETGGLSGKPLFDLSTRMLAETYLRVEDQFPLIGVGGIDSAETAFAKIEAGATLVQLYTAMVFHGPALIGDIKRGLLRILDEKNYPLLAEAIGTGAADWAAGKASLTRCR
ncbi:quinone-dependent dihydroorotate dehydrogenase [Methyloferula stellata]|uniref:quinone-dependent dihydroorotate dehydrogenase n=1 Tax=Methyloferula stellata TaxID=876270 RepID=UPI00037C4D5B|nr:quinone-dependent dihydroorotate dehydrogenase [Methyloferula stellata]